MNKKKTLFNCFYVINQIIFTFESMLLMIIFFPSMLLYIKYPKATPANPTAILK